MQWAILAAMVLVLTACATTAPRSVSDRDRWRSDLAAYEDRLEQFTAQARELQDDFQALRANPNFAAVEKKIRDLAARTGSGDTTNAKGLLVASLYTMTLGELLVFSRFLTLSTQWVTLEATTSELESLRLDLWLRRIALDRQSAQRTEVIQKVGMPASDPSLVERPVSTPPSCLTYMVGNLTFANCE